MKRLLPASGDHEVERVVFVSHPSRAAVYGQGYLLLIAAIIAAINWLRLIIDDSQWAHIALIMAGALFGLAMLSLLAAFARHRGVKVLVTTLGAIYRCKRFFTTREQTVMLSAVEKVETEQRFLGKIFNYGAVVIKAGDEAVAWRNIAQPRRVAEEIKAHCQHEHRTPPLTDCSGD